MTRWSPLASLALLILGVGTAEVASAEPTTYTLNGGRLEVLVKYDRNALIAGHDHVLVSTGFSGTVTWDPDNVGACKVDIKMPVESLVVDPPGARQRRGLEGDTSDGDKKTIKKNALSKGQLHSDEHPHITYKATGCRAAGNGAVVTGTLTMRGASKPVETTMAITADGQSFGAKGAFTSSHTAFGFSPYTALLGSLKNDDTLTFYIDVKGAPQ